MCKNATKTAASLMQAIEPSLKNILTLEGIADTPQAQEAMTAYDAALKAIQDWTPGTSTQTVVEAIDAFDQVFNTLPFPDEYKGLANIITAGITVVLGIVTANTSVQTNSEATATEEEVQAAHLAAVIFDTTTAVKEKVPGFKRAMFTSPAHQYKNAWNHEVDRLAASDAKAHALKLS